MQFWGKYQGSSFAELLEVDYRHLRLDWAELALSLGYCDQPHFVKDFKSLIGRTPDEYARGLGSAGGDSCVV